MKPICLFFLERFLMFILLTTAPTPFVQAQFPNDFQGCATAGTNIANCIVRNLRNCQQSCDVPPAPGSDDATTCDQESNCQVIQEDCCEPCREFAVDYLNYCGSCTNTFDCSFATSNTPAPTPVRTPCEQAAFDITVCPFEEENAAVCQGALCTAEGILDTETTYDCKAFTTSLCGNARDNCCEPCRNVWDTYIEECIFKAFPFPEPCGCDTAPALPTPQTPTDPAVPNTVPSTPTAAPTRKSPQDEPTSPTGPIMAGPPTVDFDSSTLAPTLDDDDQCSAEQAAFDVCAEDCQECQDDGSADVVTSLQTCNEMQNTACATAKTCCPQCLAQYSAMQNCFFQLVFNTPCTCSGEEGGSGRDSSGFTHVFVPSLVWMAIGGLLLVD